MFRIVFSIFLFLCFPISLAYAAKQLLLGAGVNFVPNHSENIQVFQNQPSTTHQSVYEPGISLQTGFGYRWKKMALFLDYLYIYNTLSESGGGNNTLSKGNAQSQHLLLEGSYFFPHLGVFEPYVGIDLGVSYIYLYQSLGFQFVNPIAIDNGAFAFAYGALVGLAYPINKQLSFDFRVRYLSASPSIRGNITRHVHIHYQAVNFSLSLITTIAS